jgi:hypothetical protein
MGEKAHRLLVEKPKGRKPLGRPRCRWADNIKMYLGDIGLGGILTGLVWLRIDTSQVVLCSIDLVSYLVT